MLLPVYAGFAPVNGVNGSTFRTRARTYRAAPDIYYWAFVSSTDNVTQ
ncbi:MAG: hypothetical protein LC732_02575 [Acidobacteria bacterium]|nr:hypothetical protein [Acidobacteriota bacterium]